jgi:SAM-dependent methyltransferase
LGGVAVLIPESGDYLLAHIKGISREVAEKDFPSAFRKQMIQAKREIENEHIEEDLESERVNALYLMTHYLRANGAPEWWRSVSSAPSAEIEELVRKYWDHGPFERIKLGLTAVLGKKSGSFVELGCGVGGLLQAVSSNLSKYLGVDSSFASIALARRIALGANSGGDANGSSFRVPGDLLQGNVSVDVKKRVLDEAKKSGSARKFDADFIVGDATLPPLKNGIWDICASVNMIDMLDEPELLPKIQKKLIHDRGLAIQSSPYVWHPEVSKALRKKCPAAKSSADAVASLYTRQGFEILKSEEQVPWVFFKHVRQVELYSVHLIFAQLTPRITKAAR